MFYWNLSIFAMGEWPILGKMHHSAWAKKWFLNRSRVLYWRGYGMYYKNKDMHGSNSDSNMHQITKIESILFVSIILSFSKNLWCLNFPPAITKQFQKRDLFWCNLFWDNAPPEAANSNIINIRRMSSLKKQMI